MKDRMHDKFKSIDLHFVSKLVCYAFYIAVFVITIWICIDAPVQHHFKNIRKNDVWFGDGWYDTGTGEKVTAVSQHYLRISLDGGHASITKTLDFTPLPEEYLCFRVRALDTVMYVNGDVWYENHFMDKFRSHSKRMYLLHQVSADGLKAGDTITLELNVESGEEHAMVQFPAMGDRYALVVYILRKSKNSLGICLIALLIMVLTLIASHSEILVNKEQDVKSLRWLTLFLAISVIYLGTDCGCMEILVERTSVVSWFNNLSFITLPIPFILFTKYAFFPGHRRYEMLAFFNFLTAMASVAMFVIFAYNMSNFYIFVHILIAFDIAACILSFFQEKLMPSFEVFLGFGAIITTASASLFFYWKELVYPSSVVFGYGLLVFSICMLVWIVRSRYELNRMREEADHVIMERDKVAAQEASEQKSRFLSSMSHEIRTPLNAILGLNELIMHESNDGKIKKYSADIQSAGRTLLALINDILDFSKIETGKMDIILSDYSLSSVLNDIVVMIQERVDRAGLDLRLDVDSTLPDVLYGDEVRIKQIIVNLMTNAVKYTKEGWIELAVRKQNVSEYLDEENILLDIRVSDTGVGIKKEDLSKLFVEFERLDRLKNRSIEGTGLGLSITSRLISLMGGKISVESEYGKGSTFEVLIPQRVVSDIPIGDYQKRFENADSNMGGETLETMRFPDKRVFVVDDNEMNLEVIASILEMLEIQVERANGGQTAMERLDREKYDLILTDDMMPEISGTELMQYIHGNEQSVSHETPIVVLTANAIAGAREAYIGKGFDDYMTKPIDVDVLQKILMKYLK
ncbi:MAG: response regulator [Lachnospiraceae bacterium]|nr:response regulator [Lachnospiraceae bacterium]